MIVQSYNLHRDLDNSGSPHLGTFKPIGGQLMYLSTLICFSLTLTLRGFSF